MYYVVCGETVDDSVCLMPPQWRNLLGNVVITKGSSFIGQSFKRFPIAMSGLVISIIHIRQRDVSRFKWEMKS